MSSNTSSSVFNEAPPSAETKPTASSAPESTVMVSPNASVPAAKVDAATSSASSSSSSSVVASSASSSATAVVSERMKNRQLEESHECSSSSTNAPRFIRVSPAVLESVKASLSFRKSCLKRSKSSFPSEAGLVNNKPVTVTKEETKKEPEAPAAPIQKNRRRCWECKVKVGLTAVTCRCDYTFCGKHRYAEEHNCAFNFKSAGKRKLEEENPVVVPLKVARIN